MKRITLEEIATAVRENEEIAILVEDAIKTIEQAKSLERLLNSNRVLGNNTLSVEAKIDALYNRQMVEQCYDIVRYDCIEALNEKLDGNVVDMTGTDKQVCRRFYNAYRKLALAV